MRPYFLRALAPVKAHMFEGADAYERYMGRWSRILAPQLVAFAGLRKHSRVLEVGCGTGALTAAVLLADPKAEVVGIDASPQYVAFARQHGMPRAHFEVGDAQELAYPDRSFDAALSLLVINLIPDARKAMNEIVRVVRHDGIVCAAVWDYGDGMEMLRWFWDAAVKLNADAEPKDERHMSYCAKGELAALFRESSLTNVIEEPLVFTQSFHSFDDYWQPFLGGQGPGGSYVKSLSLEQQGRLCEELRRRVKAERGEGPFTLQARAWAARGERSRAHRSAD